MSDTERVWIKEDSSRKMLSSSPDSVNEKLTSFPEAFGHRVRRSSIPRLLLEMDVQKTRKRGEVY